MVIKFVDAQDFQDILLKNGYSQRSFANEIGVSGPYMSQIINGNRYPGPKVAKKICEGLDVEFDQIFFIDRDNKSYHTKTA